MHLAISISDISAISKSHLRPATLEAIYQIIATYLVIFISCCQILWLPPYICRLQCTVM